jgi:hypothetical protein
MCPLLVLPLPRAFLWRPLTVLTRHTRQAIRAIKQSIFLDVYDSMQRKRISHKQSARWQHLSQLKARALFFLQKNVSCMKCNNLYSGLVTPSSGWWSPITLQYKIVASVWIENSAQYNFKVPSRTILRSWSRIHTTLFLFFVTNELAQ